MSRPIVFRAKQGSPCERCGHETKDCSRTDDGLVLCRGESEPCPGWRRIGNEPDGAGFYHYRREGERPTRPKPAPERDRDYTEQAEAFVPRFTDARRDELAKALGLPVESLALYPMIGVQGANGRGTIFTFPEYSHDRRRVVGICTRTPTENGVEKRSMPGHRRGLMPTYGWRERPGPLLIVEGASDSLAAAAADVCAIGRPGADGGAADLAKLLTDWPADRGIIVVAERDQGGAGEKGAQRLAAKLRQALRREITVAFPPDRAKDSRAWLIAPERGDTPWPERGAAFVAGLENIPTPPPPGSSSCPARAGLPTIVVTTREMEVNDQAVEALAKHDPDVFKRGGSLVQVVMGDEAKTEYLDSPAGPRISILKRATLRERLTRAANWQMEIPGEVESGRRDTNPPGWCVDAVHAREQWKPIRNLYAVVNHPVVRADGSILATPGYDPATELYLADGAPTVEVPANPTRDDARAACKVLLNAVVDFPFSEQTKDVNRAAFVAAVLTPLARYAFRGPTPLILVDANVPGAGKGLLCDTISLIVTGARFPVASYAHDPVEMTKIITASAIAGDRMILLDNITGQFGNAALDKALTGTVWKGRVLGESREVTLPLLAMWYATGNNVAIAGDAARRIIRIRLDSDLENPDEKTGFTHGPDLRSWIRENRPQLLSAALTILSAYLRAGSPAVSGMKPFGSFEGWSDTVRAAVIWAGLSDPAGNREALKKESDSEVATMTFILGEWAKIEGAKSGITTGKLLEVLFKKDHYGNYSNEGYADIREAFETLCKDVNVRTVGAKFKKFSERILGSRKLVNVGSTSGHARWAVRDTDSGGRSGRPSRSIQSREGLDQDTHSESGPEAQGMETDPLGLPDLPPDDIEAVLAEVLRVRDHWTIRDLCDEAREAGIDAARKLLDDVRAAPPLL